MTTTRRPGDAPVVRAAPRLAARAAAERRDRRSRRLRWIGRSLFVVAPLLALAWVLLLSSWLAVERVVVVGQSRLEVAQVQGAAAVPAGTPLARVDTRAVADRVARLAPVAQVQVLRSWPGTLRVELTERVAAAGVVGADGVQLVDAGGVVFATEPDLPPSLVRLQVDEPGPEDPATRAALEVHGSLPGSLRDLVRSVQATSPASVVLLLADDRKVVWGSPGDTETKAAATEALLRMEGSVFDVSAPGVVVRS